MRYPWSKIVVGACAVAVPLVSLPALSTSEDLSAWFQTRTQALVDALANGDKEVWDDTLDPHCMVTTEDGDFFDKAKMLADIRPLPPGFSGHIEVRTDHQESGRRSGSALLA